MVPGAYYKTIQAPWWLWEMVFETVGRTADRILRGANAPMEVNMKLKKKKVSRRRRLAHQTIASLAWRLKNVATRHEAAGTRPEAFDEAVTPQFLLGLAGRLEAAARSLDNGLGGLSMGSAALHELLSHARPDYKPGRWSGGSFWTLFDWRPARRVAIPLSPVGLRAALREIEEAEREAGSWSWSFS